ncbi:MAG: hypothetical protein K5829_06715 [Treponema sp.]|nr:hypothetical protein [Treponema sp.]
MKRVYFIVNLIFIIVLFLACGIKESDSTDKSDNLYKTWSNFHLKRDIEALEEYIYALENLEPKNYEAFPELKEPSYKQLIICFENTKKLLNFYENNSVDENVKIVNKLVEEIDMMMLDYLKNQNYLLQDTHQMFFNYYLLLLFTIIIAAIILIILNIRENRKKDLIIYNSEQFLRHSMEVQEDERRRIYRELHDSVAQSMRYVSLLAENLEDKTAAEKIISTQNDNIESIRKLCYKLTPPNISEKNIVDSLELLGQKIFDLPDSHFQLRIVVEDSIDFSFYSSEEIMSIYRIVQEAFQNIKKHAEASEVTVLFKKNKEEKQGIKIIISDDGKGMNEELVNQINNKVFNNSKNMHFGLRNIFERVQLLGGNVIYRSEEDCGTQIIVSLR